MDYTTNVCWIRNKLSINLVTVLFKSWICDKVGSWEVEFDIFTTRIIKIWSAAILNEIHIHIYLMSQTFDRVIIIHSLLCIIHYHKGPMKTIHCFSTSAFRNMGQTILHPTTWQLLEAAKRLFYLHAFGLHAHFSSLLCRRVKYGFRGRIT